MDNTRLIIYIGTASFLLPADVQIAETIKRFQGLQVVESIGYGRDPKYKVTGPARVSVEIVPTDDVMLAETEVLIPAAAPSTPEGDVPF